jgi:hypothetical protein
MTEGKPARDLRDPNISARACDMMTSSFERRAMGGAVMMPVCHRTND